MRNSGFMYVVNRWARPAWAAVSVSLFLLALWVIHRELADIHLSAIVRALHRVPAPALLLASLGTIGSYFVLTGYDVLALRYLRHPVPYRRVALTSFIATTAGHNLGMAMLSAGAVRLRLYLACGLDTAEVVTLAVVVGLNFGIGVAFCAGAALLAAPELIAGLSPAWVNWAPAAGAALLLVVLLYAGAGLGGNRYVRAGNWQIRLPGTGIAVGQLLLAGADLALAALALYALLPADAAIAFPAFLGIYVLALVAGIASHVPGGIGVFESVLLLALPDLPRDALLASIVLYRFIYYLVPLALAALLAASIPARALHERVRHRLDALGQVMSWLAPPVVGIAVFAAGTVLLFSGSLPARPERIHMLRGLVPLPVLEVSHLAGSMAGVALVMLAQALRRRVDAAYHVTFWLLLAGAAASLLKGLDYEEALVSLAVLGMLRMGRHAFYRKTPIGIRSYAPGAFAGLVAVLAATVWLGIFSYKHVEYAHELWWQFAFRDDAPRFLRASLLAALGGLWIGWVRLTRPAPPEPSRPSAADIERAARIVARAPQTDAALALTGDKRLLFAEEAEAFLMYQVRGRHWISMGDPVGPEHARAALAWRFREMADRHGGRVVFYLASPENLPLYLDLGLAAVKLGEEAIVPLAGFSLDSADRRALRQTLHRAEREGLRFEIVPAAAVPALLPQLKQISDAWLAGKNASEKSFSLGAFDPGYLERFPCALVRQGERIVAFANVWASAERHELSVDLMRHVPDASKRIMDYLFINLMLHGARDGYRQFNLGMAPLAGLESHPLAPAWHRFGALVFMKGEHFYNFKGLRTYKEKFDPVWRPRYLAAPGGLGLPAALIDVTALIAGGVKGILWR